MACGSCGVANFSATLGSCLRCTAIAAASAAAFWALYALAMRHGAGRILGWPLLGFAALVTLVLMAHLLAHASHVRQR